MRAYYQSVGLPKVGIKLLKLSHARICSHARILFLVPLLFVASIPTYFLNFKFFNHSSNIAINYRTEPIAIMCQGIIYVRRSQFMSNLLSLCMHMFISIS